MGWRGRQGSKVGRREEGGGGREIGMVGGSENERREKGREEEIGK